MKILLTGDLGFIASHIKKTLEKQGYEVYGYDKVRGQDLLNITELEKIIKNVDVVFHTAAQADLTQMVSLEDGRNGILSNVESTHNVAYLCAKYNKWLIYTSTVCIYGNIKKHPASEDDTLPNPSELYACSKYAGEWIVRGYGQNYNMSWTIQRYATTYGEGMRKNLGLYIFFRQAMLEEPITIHGDGRQDRTLTYIDDLVEGIISPLNYPEKAKGQIFNLTSNYSISAKKMANDVKKLVKSKSEMVFIPQRDHQIMHEDFNTSKAKRLLKWKAKTKWKDGLAKTYDWMKTQINSSQK